MPFRSLKLYGVANKWMKSTFIPVAVTAGIETLSSFVMERL